MRVTLRNCGNSEFPILEALRQGLLLGFRVLESLRDVYDLPVAPICWAAVRRSNADFAQALQPFLPSWLLLPWQCQWSQVSKLDMTADMPEVSKHLAPKHFSDAWLRILYGIDVSPRSCLPLWHSSTQGAGNHPVQVLDMLTLGFAGSIRVLAFWKNVGLQGSDRLPKGVS